MKKNYPFAEALLSWFDLHGRKDLPWQVDKTPYRVWVSEIMLQQTQVSTVIDYYQRFMKSFATVEDLANAEEDDVLEHWSGLGYYARARNLHKTAKLVHETHQGKFPDNLEGLTELPGIGRSTAGAILSIAFKQQATILDGNVKRVLCRYYGIITWPGERETEKKLWLLAEENTPHQRTDEYTQAIMDLGATLCTRSKPRCDACPFTLTCQAFQQNLQSEIPKSKPKKSIPIRHTTTLVIESDKGILLEKRPPNGIWGGLYSLPEVEPGLSQDELIEAARKVFSGSTEITERHTTFQHTFSHFKLNIEPVLIKAQALPNEIKEASRYHWVSPERLGNMGLPAPISKYLLKLYEPDLLNT